MKRTLAVFLALLVALPLAGSAQGLSSVLRLPLVESRSYTTDTYSACVTLGESGNPTGRWIQGQGRVKSVSGYDADIVTIGSTGAFGDLVAGDIIRFVGEKPDADTVPWRVVTTVTDANTIVLNKAIDLDITAVTGAQDTVRANVNYDPNGYRFEYRERLCSTSTTTWGTDAGYVSLKDFTSGSFILTVDSESGAGNDSNLDYALECYIGSSTNTPIIIASGNLAYATISAAATSVVLGNFDFGTYGWTHCRVKVKVNAADTVVYSAYVTLKEGNR